MAYTTYAFTIQKATSTNVAGVSAKAAAEELVSHLPWSVTASVTTDTNATYDAIYTIAGFDYLKLHIYNNGSIFWIEAGSGFGTSSHYKAASSISLTNSSEKYCLMTITQDMVFCLTSSASLISVGKLTSMVDGSKIEIAGLDSTYGAALAADTALAGVVMDIPVIGSEQAGQLPGDTFFVSEGIMRSSPANKAPYLLNGHGCYGVNPSRVIRGTILSNGSDTFMMLTGTVGLRL